MRGSAVTSSSTRLSALDAQRETFLLSLSPFIRYASEIKIQDAKNVTRNLDLAVSDHWADLIHLTNVGFEVSQNVPVRETLLAMSRRIAALEEGQGEGRIKKKSVAGNAVAKTKKRPESMWNESLFHLRSARQVTTVATHLQSLRDEGKRGQVLAEIVESECRYLNDLLVVKGIYEGALREQTKRTKPFISEEEIDLLFPEALSSIITVHEALFVKLAAFASPNDVMGPIISDFAVTSVRAYSDYIVGFEKVNAKLKDMLTKRAQLADFLRACKDHPQCAQRDLISLLVMPVQHLPKMQLLIEEVLKKTADSHADKKELAEALKAITFAGHRVNTEKGKSDDFQGVSDLCSNKLAECYITKVLTHQSQKAMGRRFLRMFKFTRMLGETTDQVRLFVFSDVLVVAQKKGRSDKCAVLDYVWLCESAPVVPLTYNKVACFLIESSASSKAHAPSPPRESSTRVDFSLLLDCTGQQEDYCEEFRVCVNNAIAACLNTFPPVVEGLSEPAPQPLTKKPVSKDDAGSAVASPNVSRFSTLRGKAKVSEGVGPEEAAAAKNESPPVGSPSPPTIAPMLARSSGSRQSQSRLDLPTLATPPASAKPSAVASNPAAAQLSPKVPSPTSVPPPEQPSPSQVRKKAPLVAEDKEETKSPAPGRGAAGFMDKMSQALRGGGARKGAAGEKPKVFGVGVAKLWEAKPGVPAIVSDCVAEIEARGLATEGIFRVPGSGDALKHLKRQYDSGEAVALADWDVNTVASLLLLWIRELPEPLLPSSSWNPLRSAMDTSLDEVRSTVYQLLPPPNLAVLAQLLRMCKSVSLSEAQNKMSAENLAVCLTPDLVRTEGDPLQNFKSAAHVGKLVRYLIENAAEIFPKLASSPRAFLDMDDDDDDEPLSTSAELASVGATEKKGRKLPFGLGKSGSSKDKTAKGTSKKRPKDLSFPMEETGLGEVVATEDHVGELDELRFKAGDTIIIDHIHPSGWWYGRCQGNAGIFPSAKTNAGGIVKTTPKSSHRRQMSDARADPGKGMPKVPLPGSVSPRSKRSGAPEDRSPRGSPRAVQQEETSPPEPGREPAKIPASTSSVAPVLPPKPRANSDSTRALSNSDSGLKRPMPKFAMKQPASPPSEDATVPPKPQKGRQLPPPPPQQRQSGNVGDE